MRPLIALAALALLAACGQQEEAPAPAPSSGSVVLDSMRQLPDWLLVARQAGGGDIHFNQRTITRNADGTADIWVQVRYGNEQLYQIDTETTETIIRYEMERLHYRFKCAEEEFMVVERQIMGAGETVVARDEPVQIWRALPARSVTRVVQPIACQGH